MVFRVIHTIMAGVRPTMGYNTTHNISLADNLELNDLTIELKSTTLLIYLAPLIAILLAILVGLIILYGCVLCTCTSHDIIYVERTNHKELSTDGDIIKPVFPSKSNYSKSMDMLYAKTNGYHRVPVIMVNSTPNLQTCDPMQISNSEMMQSQNSTDRVDSTAGTPEVRFHCGGDNLSGDQDFGTEELLIVEGVEGVVESVWKEKTPNGSLGGASVLTWEIPASRNSSRFTSSEYIERLSVV